MSGKTNNTTFGELFRAQVAFQNTALSKGLYDEFKRKETVSAPTDDIRLGSYHIQQLVSEIGEVLSADKRWKTHRNSVNNKQEKLDEIADCFIVLMNIAMFSGFDEDELAGAIKTKIDENLKRLNLK